MVAQTLSAFLVFLQAMITLAPRLANSKAVSIPMPALAPGYEWQNKNGLFACFPTGGLTQLQTAKEHWVFLVSFYKSIVNGSWETSLICCAGFYVLWSRRDWMGQKERFCFAPPRNLHYIFVCNKLTWAARVIFRSWMYVCRPQDSGVKQSENSVKVFWPRRIMEKKNVLNWHGDVFGWGIPT